MRLHLVSLVLLLALFAPIGYAWLHGAKDIQMTCNTQTISCPNELHGECEEKISDKNAVDCHLEITFRNDRTLKCGSANCEFTPSRPYEMRVYKQKTGGHGRKITTIYCVNELCLTKGTDFSELCDEYGCQACIKGSKCQYTQSSETSYLHENTYSTSCLSEHCSTISCNNGSCYNKDPNGRDSNDRDSNDHSNRLLQMACNGRQISCQSGLAGKCTEGQTVSVQESCLFLIHYENLWVSCDEQGCTRSPDLTPTSIKPYLWRADRFDKNLQTVFCVKNWCYSMGAGLSEFCNEYGCQLCTQGTGIDNGKCHYKNFETLSQDELKAQEEAITNFEEFENKQSHGIFTKDCQKGYCWWCLERKCNDSPDNLRHDLERYYQEMFNAGIQVEVPVEEVAKKFPGFRLPSVITYGTIIANPVERRKRREQLLSFRDEKL